MCGDRTFGLAPKHFLSLYLPLGFWYKQALVVVAGSSAAKTCVYWSQIVAIDETPVFSGLFLFKFNFKLLIFGKNRKNFINWS